MAKSPRRTHDNRRIPHPTLEEWESVGEACEWRSGKMIEAFGVSPTVFYRWMKEDDTFRSTYQRKATVGIQLLAADHYETLIKNALVLALGVQEKDDKGNLVGYKVEPNSQLLTYLIDKFGSILGIEEQSAVNININTGNSVPVSKWLEFNSVEEAKIIDEDDNTQSILPALPE